MNVRHQRKIAWASTATMLLVLPILAFLANQEQTRQALRLRDAENRIEALGDRLLNRERILAEIRLLESRNPSGMLIFSGETAAVAGAKLQGIANDIVERAGGIVQSSEIAQPVDAAPFTQIGTNLQFSASIEALRDILIELEHNVPVVIVDRIDATQRELSTRELQISMQLRGFASVPSS